MKAFCISKKELLGLKKNSISQWDSIGNAGLEAALDDTFDLTIEMKQIFDFSSFDKGMKILTRHSD